MQASVQLPLPERQKLLQLREFGNEVERLPGIALQERGVVGHMVQNLLLVVTSVGEQFFQFAHASSLSRSYLEPAVTARGRSRRYFIYTINRPRA